MYDAGTPSAQARLRDKLAARIDQAQVHDPAVVESIVRSVISTMQGDLSCRETILLAEVEELGCTIEAAKAEIAALRVDDITDNHIPSATDEMDAIVAHTASATNAILEVCETLDTLAGELPGAHAQKLSDATTRIYEACSFQDITGQRINKVVLTLKTIDQKVAHIIATFRIRGEPSDTPAQTKPGNDQLLNGPQLSMTAMDQSEIDRLMASFE